MVSQTQRGRALVAREGRLLGGDLPSMMALGFCDIAGDQEVSGWWRDGRQIERTDGDGREGG